MNRELLYVRNPWRLRIFWGILYLVIALMVVFGLYKFGNRIRTSILPEGQIQLSIPYSKYLVGEVVTFTIKNNFNGSVFIANQCPAEPLMVYRLDNNKWVRIHDSATAKDCAGEQRLVEVPANGSVSGNFAPWANLFKTPGKYRVVAYVEYYNTLPYQDFEVMSPPPIPTPASLPSQSTANKSTMNTQKTGTSSSNGSTTTDNYNPKTYTITVNSSGNYSTTSIALLAGDAINFVYSPCCGDEVITAFSPVSPTTSAIGGIKLDHDRTSRTVVFPISGTWRYKATDHNGNTGTVTVN